MKFKVFHSTNTRESWGSIEGTPLPFPQNYEHVANVECNDIDQAYMLTNHISRGWHENPQVECVKQSRSTSVGDVIIDEDGNVFMCKNVGWGEFPKELISE